MATLQPSIPPPVAQAEVRNIPSTNAAAQSNSATQPLSTLSLSNNALSAFSRQIQLHPSEMFRNAAGTLTLVEKSVIAGTNSSSYLRNNFFIGIGTNRSLMQLENAGESSLTSPSGRESRITFAGDLSITITNDIITARDSNGKVETLHRLEKNDADKIEATYNYIPLPEFKQLEYLAQLVSDEKFIVVTSPQLNYSYEGFKLFFGKAGSLQEVKIKEVERYRDGGTTYITTDLGTFFFPFHGNSPTFTAKDGTEHRMKIADRSSEDAVAFVQKLGIDIPTAVSLQYTFGETK